MKCRQCGHEDADAASNCRICGAALADAGDIEIDNGFARNRFAPPVFASRGGTDGDAGLVTKEEAWAAVIGDARRPYYMERFRRLSGGGSAAWHWPAMLFTFSWMLYRKMWLGALVYAFAPPLALTLALAVAPSIVLRLLLLVLWLAAAFIVPAVMANRWYYGHCWNRIAAVRARGGSRTQMLAQLQSAGGTSKLFLIGAALIVVALVVLGAASTTAFEMYEARTKMQAAIQFGNDVAAAVNARYEATQALPARDDFDQIVSGVPNPPRAVRHVSIDGAKRIITITVEAKPAVVGTLTLTAETDDNRHLYWTCSTVDLKRYAPSNCR